jgi:hypothetical protein
MKVYIVFHIGAYEDELKGVFKNKEDADQFIEESGGYGEMKPKHRLEEHEVIE